METKYVGKVVDTLVSLGAVKATKYISSKDVITVTRRRYGGKIEKTGNIELMVKIGKPNFKEREFIRSCKKAGEPFPVKRIQVKYPKKSV